MDCKLLNWIKVNGRLASEFSMNALWAAAYAVPMVFLSGDRGICSHAEEYCPGIVTAATKQGTGASVWCVHPEEAVEQIAQGMRRALRQPIPPLPLEDSYEMVICFREHTSARSASWYPGAELVDSHTVRIQAKDPREMITARMFMTGC